MLLKNKIKEYAEQVPYFNEMLESVIKYKDSIMEMAVNEEVDEKTFYDLTSVLSSQSRSPLWEKYFIKKLNAKKVSASKGRGDFNFKGIDYEFKISGYNKGDLLHAVQIRIWQPCDYIIVAVSPKDNPRTFVLSHDQMISELKTLKASAAHGTGAANEENENVEYRFTIDKSSPDFKRWIDTYQVSDGYFDSLPKLG